MRPAVGQPVGHQPGGLGDLRAARPRTAFTVFASSSTISLTTSSAGRVSSSSERGFSASVGRAE